MVQPREHRVPIMFSESELALLDDFRFDNRIGTRSGAARWLIHGGILLEEHAPMIVKLLDAGLIAMADAVREKPSPELLAAAQALQDLAEGIAPALVSTKATEDRFPATALRTALKEAEAK